MSQEFLDFKHQFRSNISSVPHIKMGELIYYNPGERWKLMLILELNIPVPCSIFFSEMNDNLNTLKIENEIKMFLMNEKEDFFINYDPHQIPEMYHQRYPGGDKISFLGFYSVVHGIATLEEKKSYMEPKSDHDYAIISMTMDTKL